MAKRIDRQTGILGIKLEVFVVQKVIILGQRLRNVASSRSGKLQSLLSPTKNVSLAIAVPTTAVKLIALRCVTASFRHVASLVAPCPRVSLVKSTTPVVRRPDRHSSQDIPVMDTFRKQVLDVT
ncbi:hypothetical protein MPSEU_000424800 [Mayamaea pseudoterrestris]|nr:hypothetical protein MPSEU_000424800 [Mayamaea pseudoterrestris]